MTAQTFAPIQLAMSRWSAGQQSRTTIPGKTYPESIIDHKASRERTLKAYAMVRTGSVYPSTTSAIVEPSNKTPGDDMDDEKSVLEQMTDAISNAAGATKEAAKTAVKEVRRAAKKVAKKVRSKKAKKAKKASKKSSVKKSAKKVGKKAAKKKKKARKSRR
jgi:deoxyribodipyrimidine photolyase